MPLESLEKLFIQEVSELYDAEEQLLKALPKMAEAASSEELSSAFEEHLRITEEHAKRLEQVFEELGEKPSTKKCKAMSGLIAEGEDIIKQKADPSVLDAAIIGAAQKAEHYEIAAYGTVRTWARRLGYERPARLLQKTLDEESETDEKLTQIAESLVNPQAAGRAGR